MSFLSFSSKTFFELSQIYCLRIDFAFVWDFYIPHTFSETLFSFQGTTVAVWQLLYYIMPLEFWQAFFSFSSLSNDSLIILSSFCSLDKLLALPPGSASCLPQTACITLQTLNQRKIKCSIKKWSTSAKRRLRDSNPRAGINRPTPLAGAPLQPLE